MAKKKELSPTMKEALAFAIEHGGKLARYPGGFWMEPGLDSTDHLWMNRIWFGTTTVQSLVARGEMFYSCWKEGRSRFPIEAQVK